RRGDRLEELVAPVVARSAADALGNRDAEPAGERLDGLREIQAIDLPHEVDDVAARAAAEAVIKALLAIHGERRRAFVVERAETLPGAARLLQPRALADHLDDVGCAAQLREHPIVDVEHGQGLVLSGELSADSIALTRAPRSSRRRRLRSPRRRGGTPRPG